MAIQRVSIVVVLSASAMRLRIAWQRGRIIA
jgi:hypothetical protein